MLLLLKSFNKIANNKNKKFNFFYKKYIYILFIFILSIIFIKLLNFLFKLFNNYNKLKIFFFK